MVETFVQLTDRGEFGTIGIPYKIEAGICFLLLPTGFFFSVYIIHIGKRPLCFSSVMCLVEGNEDGGCFVFCFSGCMLLLFWSYF